MFNFKAHGKRISCLLLGGTLLCSVSLTACSDKGKQSSMPTFTSKQNGKGLQDIKVSESDYDFFKNGQSDYVVVIPSDANEIVRNGAQELTYFVYQSTEVSLSVVSDEGLSYSDTSKYISLGNTTIAEQAKVVADYDLVGSNGYVIDTVGQSVFCVGGGDYGTLYSVYEFLKHTFGYKIYASDEIVYETGVKNKKLMDFDIKVRPTFQWRHTSFSKVDYDATHRMRFRELPPNEMFIRINGAQWVHNSLAYIPYNEKNKTEHSEWFSSASASYPDLCYSNEGTLEEVIKVMKKNIIANPTKELVTISSPDGQKMWCGCKDCTASLEKYGTNSAVLIKFCNAVNKEIKRWIAEDGEVPKSRHVQIIFLGYSQTIEPPVKEVNGKYVPIDDSVVCDDGVSVMYCMNVSGSDFYTDVRTQVARTQAEKWKVISKEQFNTWIYTENFHHYLPFADGFGSLKSVYSYSADMDTFFMLNNAQCNPDDSTGFCNLKNYIDYELMWDVNKDYDVIVNEFFTNYFKEAEVPMRKLFDALRAISLYQREVQGTSFGNFGIVETEYWTLPFLQTCMSYVEEAYQSIEPLKNKKAELYEKLHNRINLESMCVRFLIIELYGSTYIESELLEEKLQFKADAEKLGLTHQAETKLITNLWSEWGI